ncbi:MAG: outer membrane protein assembly factor BamE [Bdellovibrionaceae bacterium]|nr:outer membrane protein assembly factor BamE [Pseudobdellovibrionaceae bacterium]NUM59690.1 outer membrane protein assembly factor BamE [Pseudobdellovibrionaceae bacterium]
MRIFFFLMLPLALFLSACQTNMIKEFNDLKVGYDKHQVIEKIGSPRHMLRMSGEDRWYYMFYNDDQRFQKEVHFKDGLVIYFGDKKIPQAELLPETIDAKNEEKNKIIDIEKSKRDEDSKNAYADYLKYEKKVKKEDRVHYLPDFEPVD